MSYFKVKCPWCGAEYMTGVVGNTLMGSHSCKASKPCEYDEGCDSLGVFQVKFGEQFEFRCAAHIERVVIYGAQPRAVLESGTGES